MDAWITYGLGSENDSLTSYVVMPAETWRLELSRIGIIRHYLSLIRMGVLQPDRKEFELLLRTNPLQLRNVHASLPLLGETANSLAAHGLVALANLLMAPLVN